MNPFWFLVSAFWFPFWFLVSAFWFPSGGRP
jgi:hypothetical protein